MKSKKQIQALNKVNENPEFKIPKKQDIIITKYEEKVEYDKDKNKIIKRIPYKVNITKKVNETAKLIKVYTAEEKLEEIEKIAKTK